MAELIGESKVLVDGVSPSEVGKAGQRIRCVSQASRWNASGRTINERW